MSASSPALPGLPHGHPFVFVDRVVGDGSSRRTVLRVTAGASTGRGSLPATLLLEAMAQSALALLSAEPPEGDGQAPRSGSLVGIDEASFDPSLIADPPLAGDSLVGSCEVRGRFGPMVKVGASLERDGVRVASAELLLTAG